MHVICALELMGEVSVEGLAFARLFPHLGGCPPLGFFDWPCMIFLFFFFLLFLIFSLFLFFFFFRIFATFKLTLQFYFFYIPTRRPGFGMGTLGIRLSKSI